MASVLKVDKLDPQSGTALEIGTSGDTISIPSGATLDISASTLTPPATMPASSGINLTALNATNLGSGTVPTARLGTGTASSSVFLAGDNTWIAAGGGITDAESWRLNTSFTGDAEPIASNLEICDTDSPGSIGSSMTESSGVFTFPSTGIWLIMYDMTWGGTVDSIYMEGRIDASTNTGGTWSSAAISSGNISYDSGSTHNVNAHAKFMFDVTNTTTHLLRFTMAVADNAVSTLGYSTDTVTGMIFIRLGDT